MVPTYHGLYDKLSYPYWASGNSTHANTFNHKKKILIEFVSEDSCKNRSLKSPVKAISKQRLSFFAELMDHLNVQRTRHRL